MNAHIPGISTLLGKHFLTRRRASGRPQLVFASGLTLVFLLFYFVHDAERETRIGNFKHSAQFHVSAIRERLVELKDAEVAVRSLLHISVADGISSADFAGYVKDALGDKHDIRSVAWVRTGSAGRTDTTQSGSRVQHDHTCSLPPHTSANQPFQLCGLAILGNGASLLGSGLAGNPGLVSALKHAAETNGDLVVTFPPAVYGGQADERALHGLYVFAAGKGRVRRARATEAGGNPEDLLIIDSYIPDMIGMALDKYAGNGGGDGIDIYLTELVKGGNPRLLYVHPSRLRRQPLNLPLGQAPGPGGPLVTTATLHFGTSDWRLTLVGVPAAFDLSPSRISLSVLFGGSVLVSMLTAMLIYLTRRNRHTEKLVAYRTRELAAANDALEEEIQVRKHTEEKINYDLMVKNTINTVLEIATEKSSLNEKLERILWAVLDADWLSIDTRGSIFLAGAEGNSLVLTVQRGLAGPLLDACAEIPFGKCLCGRAAASREIVFTGCLEHRHEVTYEDIDEHGHYCVPVLSGQKVLGVLNLYVEAGHEQNESERGELTAIANILAGLIEREQHLEMIGRTLKDLDNQVYALDEHAIVSVTDVAGRITYANDKFCETTQYSREELIGKTHQLINSGVHPPEYFRELWNSITSGRAWKGETCNRKRDGTLFWVAATIVPFLDKRGVPYKYVAIRLDITSNKETEQQLLGRNQEIERAHRELESSHTQLLQAEKLASVGQLAAGIAHEINTPIQFVGDNTRFLQESFDELIELVAVYESMGRAAAAGPVPPDLADRARALHEQVEVDYLAAEVPRAIVQTLEGVERISQIVSSMKDFSHPGSGLQDFVDINQAIDTTITVSRNEWKYDAELVTDFDPRLTAVPCYRGEINQVILNIIVNAAHAIGDARGDDGAKGVITIGTRLVGDVAEIRIGDTGTGMTEEVRRRIFEPFFTTKGVGKGSGQGLAIAYAVVVERHGGDIEVDTVPGKGTTFILRLPMKERFAATATDTDQVADGDQAHTVCG